MSTFRYEMNSWPKSDWNAKLLYAARSIDEGEWHNSLHSHTCVEIFYILAGAGEFKMENESFSVLPDDMVIINPQVEHTEQASTETPLEYIVIGIEEGTYYVQDEKLPAFLHFKCGADGRSYLQYLFALQKELETQDLHHQTAAHYLLELFLINLKRSANINTKEASSGKAGRVCHSIKMYIDNHYTENITLEQLADLAHLNKYYMAHMFKQEYGISPIQYLLQRRLQESRYFLTNTNYSMAQIAGILGFSSTSYFSQRFRQAEGMPPTEWRCKMAGKIDDE